MTEQQLAELAAYGLTIPPSQDELPYSDGEPMESQRHVLQMTLLIESLELHWKDRPEGFVGGNMFVYFSMDQTRGRHFRGPDVFAVLDAPKRERKSWVVWEENRAPDVIIELLSESTERIEKGEKKRVYQDELRVPEYFWYDPFGGELAGFRLSTGRYKPIRQDKQGRLRSETLGLFLVRKEGGFRGVQAPWLRWTTDEGQVLPTGEESAEEAQRQAEQAQRQVEEAQRQAEQAQRQAEQAQRQAEQAQRQAEQAQTLLARYRERFGSID